MEHKVHELAEGIKIQQYNNGSYGYFVEGKGWRNIPKTLGEVLVKKFSISHVSDAFPWDDEQVICFVNFFLKLHKIDDRFTLENQSIVESYKNGDIPEQWW